MAVVAAFIVEEKINMSSSHSDKNKHCYPA